jgi:hypothetical protein
MCGEYWARLVVIGINHRRVEGRDTRGPTLSLNREKQMTRKTMDDILDEVFKKVFGERW